MNGIVRRFNSKRGFGFIEPLIGQPENTEAVFFHISCVRGRPEAIPEGAEVRFVLVRGKDGRPQAANVELVPVPASSVLETPA